MHWINESVSDVWLVFIAVHSHHFKSWNVTWALWTIKTAAPVSSETIWLFKKHGPGASYGRDWLNDHSPAWGADLSLNYHTDNDAGCVPSSLVLDETSYEAGIKVQLHTQSEPPFLHELGFGVAPGFQTFVSTQEQRVVYDCLGLLHAAHTALLQHHQLSYVWFAGVLFPCPWGMDLSHSPTNPPPFNSPPSSPPHAAEATPCNICSLSLSLSVKII